GPLRDFPGEPRKAVGMGIPPSRVTQLGKDQPGRLAEGETAQRPGQCRGKGGAEQAAAGPMLHPVEASADRVHDPLELSDADNLPYSRLLAAWPRRACRAGVPLTRQWPRTQLPSPRAGIPFPAPRTKSPSPRPFSPAPRAASTPPTPSG